MAGRRRVVVKGFPSRRARARSSGNCAVRRRRRKPGPAACRRAGAGDTVTTIRRDRDGGSPSCCRAASATTTPRRASRFPRVALATSPSALRAIGIGRLLDARFVQHAARPILHALDVGATASRRTGGAVLVDAIQEVNRKLLGLRRARCQAGVAAGQTAALIATDLNLAAGRGARPAIKPTAAAGSGISTAARRAAGSTRTSAGPGGPTAAPGRAGSVTARSPRRAAAAATSAAGRRLVTRRTPPNAATNQQEDRYEPACSRYTDHHTRLLDEASLRTARCHLSS
jgi:hypothetical protein